MKPPVIAGVINVVPQTQYLILAQFRIMNLKKRNIYMNKYVHCDNPVNSVKSGRMFHPAGIFQFFFDRASFVCHGFRYVEPGKSALWVPAAMASFSLMSALVELASVFVGKTKRTAGSKSSSRYDCTRVGVSCIYKNHHCQRNAFKSDRSHIYGSSRSHTPEGKNVLYMYYINSSLH